jgi:outer membrane protein assembly factor BamA
LRAARAAKTRRGGLPVERGRLESAFLWVERNQIPQRFTGAAPVPLRVLPGGIGPNTGIGARLAYVPFYARPDLDVFFAAGGSLRGYWVLEATAGYRRGALFGYGYTRRRFRQDRFAVTEDNRALLTRDDLAVGDRLRFDLDDWTTGGLLGVRATDRLNFAGGLAYAVYDPAENDLRAVNTNGPSLLLTERTRYLSLSTHLLYDSRDSRYERGFGERYTPNTDELTDRPLSPHRGTLLSFEAFRFLENSATNGNFTQYQFEVQQYVSFRSEYHTLALRHRTTFTDPDNDAGAPFYLLPYVGGNYTLRGYPNFRFRDLHATLTNLEYRWRVWILMDLVAFVDVGKTFSEADAWGFTDLDRSVGGGVRLASTRSTFVRLEVARSRENTRVILVFNAAF